MSEKRKATPKNIVLIRQRRYRVGGANGQAMLKSGFVPPLRLVIEIIDANGAVAKSTYDDCKDFPLGGYSR